MSHKVIKHRDIGFCSLQPDIDMARSAVLIINDLTGVLMSHALDHKNVHVAYDLNCITFEEINSVLIKQGFHLDNTILAKMKRGIAFYCEEAFLENCRRERVLDAVKELKKADNEVIFLRSRKGASCECRDQRPSHWRKYL